MTTKIRWIALSTIFFATAANAQVVMTHGTVLGQSCYLQTRINGDAVRALETCTLALERDLMGANDRAATFDNRGVILDRMQRLEEAQADFDKNSGWKDSVLLTVVNGSIGLKSENGWSVSVWGKNLFDKYYWSAVASKANVVVRFPNPPRTWGATLGFDF